MADVEVSLAVDAPPDVVWALIADVTRMGEWSPETQACTWLGGADHAVPGARFRGTNRNGPRRWSSTASVTSAEPGKRFGFRVTFLRLDVADWVYELNADDAGGCTVTESWTDLRGRTMKALGGPGTGVTDRPTHNRAGMQRTLAAIKAAAEAA